MTSFLQTDSLPLPLPDADRGEIREWLSQYLGKPGEHGAEGPDSFDCYGLCRNIKWFSEKILLPEFPGVDRDKLQEVSKAIQGQAENGPWVELAKPVHGCVVALSRNRKFHHCGLYLAFDGGRVIHLAPSNVIMCEKISVVLRSFSKLMFFQYANGCHSPESI